MKMQPDHDALVWLAAQGKANFTLPNGATESDIRGMEDTLRWLGRIESVGLIQVLHKRSSMHADERLLVVTATATTRGHEYASGMNAYVLVKGPQGEHWAVARDYLDGGSVIFHRADRRRRVGARDAWPDPERLGELLKEEKQ